MIVVGVEDAGEGVLEDELLFGVFDAGCIRLAFTTACR